ncbi:MAG: hypothetical protein KDA24_11425 [Deltaproteobacteria bacterium]|nr:hypothetical protein [Deltaproteobacteria bacterium]
MTTFIFTLTFFALAMVGLAVGVIVSNRQLQGSCGGVGSDDCLCSLEKRRACAKEEVARRRAGGEDEALFFDMSRLKKGDHPPKHDHTH